MTEFDRLMDVLIWPSHEDAEIIAMAEQESPTDDPDVCRQLALIYINMERDKGPLSLTLQALEIRLCYSERNPFYRYVLALNHMFPP